MTSVAPKIALPTTSHGSRRPAAATTRIGSAAVAASAATPCVTLFAISSPTERRRSAIRPALPGLRTDVLERTLHVDAHHLLPPGEREVGVVHRFGGPVCG